MKTRGNTFQITQQTTLNTARQECEQLSCMGILSQFWKNYFVTEELNTEFKKILLSNSFEMNDLLIYEWNYLITFQFIFFNNS